MTRGVVRQGAARWIVGLGSMSAIVLTLWVRGVHFGARERQPEQAQPASTPAILTTSPDPPQPQAVSTVSALATVLAASSSPTRFGPATATPVSTLDASLLLGSRPLTPPSQTPGALPAADLRTVEPAAPTAPVAVLLDQRFNAAEPGWPNHPQSTAWYADNAYYLFAREPAHFVAVGAPLLQPVRDVTVTGTFHKVGGPPGGGYGLILRDQLPALRDGISQVGTFYVVAASDVGNFGVWRHDMDHWVDLVPWTPSAAINTNDRTNEILVRALGSQLMLLINGVQVAELLDADLGAGGVGIFVGGDGNQVAAEHFSVAIAQ